MNRVSRALVRWTARALNTVLPATWNWPSSTWWGWSVMESNTGLWQRNVTIDGPQTLLAFSAVYACVTGIASDVAKLRIKLTENDNGIWEEITEEETHGNANAAQWLAILEKPNHFQTRYKFIEQWIVSKLLWGNAYILKDRNPDRSIRALYVLSPQRVKAMVSDGGDVFYELQPDLLSQVETAIIIPASEIIHDSMVSLFHPLIGVSPIFACSVSATMGNKIQANSTNFFLNASRPSGVITAPKFISQASADAVKAAWESGFSGLNQGRTAILGDGMTYEAFVPMPASDAQLIEQLKWTVEDVARAFHYPLYKLQTFPVGFSWNNVQVLQVNYYSDCLQCLIESLEASLDSGLELPDDIGTEMDLDGLLRMDTVAMIQSMGEGVKAAILTPNDARARLNYPPITGGDSAYMQQQNFSLEALAKRDAQADPFGKNPTTTTQSQPQQAIPAATTTDETNATEFEAFLRKELEELIPS